MMPTISLLMLLGAATGLQVGSPATTVARATARARPPLMIRPPSWNPLENLKQMADQRVARVSHCMLAAGTDMTLEQANAKIEAWKAEVGNDAAKFAELAARESQCEKTATDGGELGIFPRAKLSTEVLGERFEHHCSRRLSASAGSLLTGCGSHRSRQVANLVFQEDVKPIENGGSGGVVRGPIGTNFFGQAGLSLVYVHTCWEPMSTGVVGALFDPPDSMKKKMSGALAGKE